MKRADIEGLANRMNLALRPEKSSGSPEFLLIFAIRDGSTHHFHVSSGGWNRVGETGEIIDGRGLYDRLKKLFN